MDRLERLVKIMGLCVKLETLDEARAVKTIEKIGSVSIECLLFLMFFFISVTKDEPYLR